MLIMLVADATQPIYVTIQQPAGMPEWIKVLITAGSGAMFGLLTAVTLEYVKPFIAKRSAKKLVSQQLIAEIKSNLNKVESGAGILEEEARAGGDQDLAMSIASTILSSVNSDRYRFYFEKEKPVVYELDADKTLSEFYSSLSNGVSFFEKAHFDGMRVCFRYSTLLGHRFIRAHKIDYKYEPTIYDTMHRDKKK